MYRRKVGCLFCGENYKDPLGSAPAVFTPATGLMKPSPCSCRSHLDCREKDRRSWEVSIEWLASPFSFRALPHVHQPQLLVFFDGGHVLGGSFAPGLWPSPHQPSPLPPGAMTGTRDPSGRPDFLAACMLPGAMDFWPLASPIWVISWIKDSFWTSKYYLTHKSLSWLWTEV